MIQEIVLKLGELVVGTILGCIVTYLVWVTKSLFHLRGDVDIAFNKIRALESEHDRDYPDSPSHS